VRALFEKTIAAAREFKAREIIVAGGVSANKALREAFRSQTEFRVHIPHISLCTDNAAMIAAAGYRHFIADETSNLDFDVQANWSLAETA
jgi:N6-L-threonylcarbamoyladenine synthase